MKRRAWLVCAALALAALLCAAATAAGFSTDPDAIEKAAASVFLVEVYDKNGDEIATGSGFLMFDDSTLVTACHVIDGAASLLAESDEGTVYELTGVLAADADKDLALLRFAEPTGRTVLEAASKTARRGETVTAIGSPEGLKNTVSIGNVSSVSADAIQFTAPVSHGSSGGALFDEDGRVAGVTNAALLEDDAQNLNFAVPVSEVAALWNAWDGTTVRPVSDGAAQNGGGTGFVSSGGTGSSAGEAGASYASTRRFLAALDAAEISYALCGIDDGDEKVTIENRDEDGNAYTIYCWFTQENDEADLRVWDVITFAEKDLGKVTRAVNALNAAYRWVKFYVDKTDMTVTASLDLILRDTDNAGEIALEGCVRLVQVLTEAYAALGPMAK